MKKEKIKNIVLIMVVAVISSTVTSFATSNYLFDSIDVKYDNSNGVQAETVQGAIDELYACASDYSEIRNMIYPVGSVYISVEDDTVAKVQARFGGTWEAFGEGRTLVGMGSNGTTNYTTVESTSGSESQSYTPAGTNEAIALTVDQLPSHSHTYSKSPTATDSTTLNLSQIPSHTHAFTKGADTILAIDNDLTSSETTAGFVTGTSTTAWNSVKKSRVTLSSAGGNGGHTHGITLTTANTGSKGNNETHTHTFTGTSATISHMQPYITVYMYKRVS